MDLHRINVKLYFENPGAVDCGAFINLFHRWISEHEGSDVLIDVADYQHVPNGPGVMLIGHEHDYAVDYLDGEAGLLYMQKRGFTGSLGERLPAALRHLLTAAQRIEGESDLPEALRFKTGRLRVSFPDRLQTPNSAEAFEAVQPELACALTGLFGAEPTLSRVYDDPRWLLAIDAAAPQADDLSTLLGRVQDQPAPAG